MPFYDFLFFTLNTFYLSLRESACAERKKNTILHYNSYKLQEVLSHTVI